jgi:predicted RNase H-like HicB family nuclease
MRYSVEFERETDGRWIAEISTLPGAMVYGTSKKEAGAKVRALAFSILAAKSA